MDVQQAAQEAYDCFESAQRVGSEGDDGRFYRLKDGSPGWVKQLVQDAHGEMSPDDYRYEAIMDACSYIADNENPEGAEFADDHVDVYNSARASWLASHLRRGSYCDEALSELGGDIEGVYALIGLGQYYELSEVFGAVEWALTERAECGDMKMSRPITGE